MRDRRLPLAFYTAVDGYAWHCSDDGQFSASEYAALEEHFFSPDKSGCFSIAGVFSYESRVFFYRYLRAENFDSDSRSVKYIVVGAVNREDVKAIDFCWIFKQDVFQQPISHEDAMASNFPAVLCYDETKGATESFDEKLGYARPTKSFILQYDSDYVISCIGAWFNDYDDLSVRIFDDMIKPRLEVKIQGRHQRCEETVSNGISSNQLCTSSSQSNSFNSQAGELRDSTQVESANGPGANVSGARNNRFWVFLGGVIVVVVCVMWALLSILNGRKCPFCNGTGRINVSCLYQGAQSKGIYYGRYS